MVKLKNFRCTKCFAEKEVYIDTNEPNDLTVVENICECGYAGTLKPFNFKNNNSRFRFCDTQDDDYDYWQD